MVNWVITILRMRIVFCLFSFFRISDREFLLIFRITYRGGMMIIVQSKRISTSGVYPAYKSDRLRSEVMNVLK